MSLKLLKSGDKAKISDAQITPWTVFMVNDVTYSRQIPSQGMVFTETKKSRKINSLTDVQTDTVNLKAPTDRC